MKKKQPLAFLNQNIMAWGAEFLEDEVRVCQLKFNGDTFSPGESFSGDYDSAEKFAQKNHLKWAGVEAAVSHLPYKVSQMAAVGSEENEFQEERERLRPVGLTEFELGEAFLETESQLSLVHYREEGLSQFKETLPDGLSTLNNISLSPLILHRYLLETELPQYSIVVMTEESSSHCLIYGNKILQECIEIPFGRDLLKDSPELYALEISKLECYSLSTHGSHKIGAFMYPKGLLSQVEENLLAKTPLNWESVAPPLGLEFSSKNWIAGLLAYFQIKTHIAKGIREDTFSIGSHNSDISENQKVWRQRSFQLAKISGWVILILSLTWMGLGIISFSLDKLTAKDRMQLQENIRQMDKIAKTKNDITRNMEKLGAVLGEKSRVSEYLQKVAKGLPDKTWLKSIEVEHAREKGHQFLVIGYCFAEDKISRILEGLEKQKFSEVKLKYTERIPGEKIQKQTELRANNQDIIEFAILLKP